jgi:hypothetical protein
MSSSHFLIRKPGTVRKYLEHVPWGNYASAPGHKPGEFIDFEVSEESAGTPSFRMPSEARRDFALDNSSVNRHNSSSVMECAVEKNK